MRDGRWSREALLSGCVEDTNFNACLRTERFYEIHDNGLSRTGITLGNARTTLSDERDPRLRARYPATFNGRDLAAAARIRRLEALSNALLRRRPPVEIWVKAGSFFDGMDYGSNRRNAGRPPGRSTIVCLVAQHDVFPQAVVCSYLVTFGGVCVEIGLIASIFTDIAAPFGRTVNAGSVLAQTVSTDKLRLPNGAGAGLEDCRVVES